MTDEQQQPLSRAGHFAAGVTGEPEHIATAIPPPQQADPTFQPASVQMSQNQYSGVGNGSSDNTMSVLEPYQKSMRDQLRAGGGVTP